MTCCQFLRSSSSYCCIARLQTIIQKMFSKTALLFCLFAVRSSAAFALHGPQPYASSTSSRATTAATMPLRMSGGGADSAPPPPELKPPPALYQGAVAAGAAKAAAPFSKIFTLGIVSGAHIAFGAYLAISVGGACPGLAQTNPGLQKIVMVGGTCGGPVGPCLLP